MEVLSSALQSRKLEFLSRARVPRLAERSGLTSENSGGGILNEYDPGAFDACFSLCLTVSLSFGTFTDRQCWTWVARATPNEPVSILAVEPHSSAGCIKILLLICGHLRRPLCDFARKKG